MCTVAEGKCFAHGEHSTRDLRTRTNAFASRWLVPHLPSRSYPGIGLEVIGTDVGNAIRLPARTTIDVGVRYRFSAGDAPAVIRLQVRNLFDNYSWNAPQILETPHPATTTSITLR